MKKITIGASERAELRQICNVIKANPTHYETVTYTNKDATASIKVKYSAGDKLTYKAVITVIVGEKVATETVEAGSFNIVENKIRACGSVDYLTELSNKTVSLDKPNHVSLRKSEQPSAQQRRGLEAMTRKAEKTDPLDLVLMDSLLIARKSFGVVYRGQVLNFKCARNNQGAIEIIASINTMFNNDLQYAGSMFYTLDRLAYDIRNGNVAILSHSAPTKVLRVYGWGGDYETIAVNQKARLSSVIENFMIEGGSRRIEFRPFPESN